MSGEDTDSVKVAVRMRPFNETDGDGASRPPILSMHGQTVTITDPATKATKDFSFDYCFNSFDGSANQFTVWEALGEMVLTNSFKGYNSCLFAYGCVFGVRVSRSVRQSRSSITD